jgi:hypothetical protein
VPGKEERARAHRNGVPTVRRRKRRRAVAFNGGGVVPMVVDERGEVLQLKGDPGVRRRQSIEEWSSLEGTHWRGADGGDTWTKSGTGEVLRWRKIGEEDAWVMGTNVRRSSVDGRDERRGGRCMEAEWEREREREKEREGGPGAAWSSTAARCRARVENGGVGATWIDVADRWAGTLWGPDHQRLGAARGSTVRWSAQR